MASIPPTQEQILAAALRYAGAGFLVHPLDADARPLKGFQDRSTRDPDEVRRQFASTPRPVGGVGYLIGNKAFRGKDHHGDPADYDLVALDIDDGRAGLAQLRAMTEEIRRADPGWWEDMGEPVELPRTMTIRTPSGNQQRVFVVPHDPEREPMIGCRLDTSLELKAASKDGRPISGRLPPTQRAPKGDKSGGSYAWRRRVLPQWLPWPWEERFLDLADGVRERASAVPNTPPPETVGDYDRAEAGRLLRRACRKIAGTRSGRRTAINDWSLIVGRLAWALDPEKARKALVAAARKSGWPGDIERTVSNALQDGARSPRDVRRSTLKPKGRKRVDKPLALSDKVDPQAEADFRRALAVQPLSDDPR